MSIISGQDVRAAIREESLQRSAQRQTDMLYLQHMIDCYGSDTVLTWWINATKIMYGNTLPSPSTIRDPRR